VVFGARERGKESLNRGKNFAKAECGNCVVESFGEGGKERRLFSGEMPGQKMQKGGTARMSLKTERVLIRGGGSGEGVNGFDRWRGREGVKEAEID